MDENNKMLQIESEKQFLQYVHDVFNEEQEPQDLVFKSWPNIEIDISGERYHSSLPTKLMEGFVSFQQELDRAYALILYRAANRQKLTNDDKDALELVFKIQEGSTGASSGLGDWVNGICNKLEVVLEDMSGKQKTALIALLILSVTGSYAVTEFNNISSKVEIEKLKAEAQANAEQQRSEQIETLTETTDAALTTLREVVLSEVRENSPRRGQQVIDVVTEGYKTVFRSAQDAEKISIGETDYSKEEIETISARPDVVKDVTEDSGEFYIESIKKRDYYLTVGVLEVSTGNTFNVKVDTSFLKDEEKDTIHNSFRDGTSVTLDYQANVHDGEIVNARLIKVSVETDSGDEDVAE